MKKTVTYTEEVLVCDYCEVEENLPSITYIKTCDFCGKDVCSKHYYELRNPEVRGSYVKPEIICRTHVVIERKEEKADGG